MSGKNSGFSSKIGYVLAAAGSAVGLGNIWRFPYLTAKYGGGIFLLTYLVLVLTFGYALLVAENNIGRITGKGPVGAYRHFCSQEKTGLNRFIGAGGWINAIVPLIIVPYYCVIGGWVTKYLVAMIVNPVENFKADNMVQVGEKAVSYSANYFTNFITSTWEPVFYFLVFAAIMGAVIAFGVEKGVERFNKICMPALFVLLLCICAYVFFLPNSGAGFRYYLMPDTSKFSFMTVVGAMGQLFFSLSIAMGIMITYGSYMRKEDDLAANVSHVEFFDTMAAFLAGLMIIPAVVAFGGPEAAESAGPGLVFITMPQVFASLSPIAGKFLAALFFLLVLFAASTSAISLLETNVQSIGQELKLTRKASIIIGMTEIVGVGIITILGYSVLSFVKPLSFLPICKNMDILDSLDFLSNNIMMPIAAIFTTMLVLGVIGLQKFSASVAEGRTWKRKFVFEFCMLVIIIPCLLLILLNSIFPFSN